MSIPISMSTVSGARDATISAAELAALRPHLVNLTRGRLSSTGMAITTERDVEQIFAEHLPAFVDTHGGAHVPVVFWAHGGLVDEASGLRIAHGQVRWWLSNGVYPVFFTWEAGFGDALDQLFASWIGSRGLLEDAADRLAEWTARHLGGTKIWGAMKSSAELASAPGGGARIVAERLGRYIEAHQEAVRLHAVGHSAGAIFHRYFLPEAVRAGAAFDSLALLAPAVRADEFLAEVAPLLGQGVGELSMFTMDRAHEKADVCAAGSFVIYHDSLLMLIRAALEDTPGTAILGLEESVQADAQLWQLFGPGHPANVEAVWSPSPAGSPLRASSTSTSHGGFDNDPPTMESLVRRITDDDEVQPFPAAGTSERAPDVVAVPTGVMAVGPVASAGSTEAAGGRKRALCVGIDAYPAPHALRGCVADARAWAAALAARGFEADLLLDTQATRQAVVDHLAALVGASSAGDVIVFQYSGHGTTVTDVDGDEPYDQALCPVDFASGALLVDDDIREIIAALPGDVNMTCFLDSCHSATATRKAFVSLTTAPRQEVLPGVPRFILADAALEAAHRSFRLRTGPGTAGPAVRGTELMREITFSACLQSELAYETGGRGDYSRVAVPLLALAGLTNREFQDRVAAAMGQGARQHPYLDSAPSTGGKTFLEPMSGSPAMPTDRLDRGISDGASATATFLRALAAVIERP